MAEQQVQQAAGPVSQWVTFELDDATYGIGVMQVREVLPMTEIAPVPGAPPHVMGIINLRGNVVTVIGTRMRFGLPSREPEAASRIVVIETGSQVAGILVDGVAEVTCIHDSEIDTAPGTGNEESARYIQGVVRRGDDLLILVDVDRLLAGQEWGEVAAL